MHQGTFPRHCKVLRWLSVLTSPEAGSQGRYLGAGWVPDRPSAARLGVVVAKVQPWDDALPRLSNDAAFGRAVVGLRKGDAPRPGKEHKAGDCWALVSRWTENNGAHGYPIGWHSRQLYAERHAPCDAQVEERH